MVQTYLTGNSPCEQRLLLSCSPRKEKKGSCSKMEGTEKKIYDWVTCGRDLQSTPITRTFKGNRKKVQVIGSSKKIAGTTGKGSFHCTVNILSRNVK